MTSRVKDKLKKLPQKPGVYFHKNFAGEIIYVGKAANLNNRVRQYFQNSRFKDPKTILLVSEIDDIEWQETSGEAEALFLEAELVKRYQPKFNILLRDDKSNTYIRIDIKSEVPTVTLTRRPLDDDAKYFGPFLSAWPVKRALRFLRKTFPYSTHTTLPSRACLDVHLGLCPGPETKNYDRGKYISDLRNLINYIQGSKVSVLKSLETDMNNFSKIHKYEEAAQVRNRINNLKSLQNQIIFGDRESLDISKDHALSELTLLFNLKSIPRRIEAYDISHLQGTDTVASMVVFSSGVADKSAYRKFKIRNKGNDDYANMQEVLSRRFNSQNLKKWPKPEFIIIDGGKGQLSAANKLLSQNKQTIFTIGLAKRQEEINIQKIKNSTILNLETLKKLKGTYLESEEYISIILPMNSNIIKLLQRIRDESHRFAISYHSALRQKRQTNSLLDDINGIGPKTKKKLIQKFGSLKNVESANYSDLTSTVGAHRAKIIRGFVVKKHPK